MLIYLQCRYGCYESFHLTLHWSEEAKRWTSFHHPEREISQLCVHLPVITNNIAHSICVLANCNFYTGLNSKVRSLNADCSVFVNAQFSSHFLLKLDAFGILFCCWPAPHSLILCDGSAAILSAVILCAAVVPHSCVHRRNSTAPCCVTV